jgi:hypothetical protein
MFEAVHMQQVNMDRKRKTPNRLIYLGNESRPYGINERDTWNMSTYMAAIMANGLRMINAYGHLCRDEEEYERIASKLEFYSIDYNKELHDNIDWSNDDQDLLQVDENGYWISPEEQPGFDEYCKKSEQIEYWQRMYMLEGLNWLSEHWGELWD